MRAIAIGFGAAVLIGAACGAAFVYSGVYDVSATDQHTKPVYWLIQFTMRRSVAVRAGDDGSAEAVTEDMLRKGMHVYHARCLQCHGAPGISPTAAALGMTPVPSNLVSTAREWSASEIRWVVTHGIKMTGMPAWKHRMSDEEIAQVVAFVKRELPNLTPGAYRALAANIPEREDIGADSPQPRQPSADAGRRAIDQYACATCHAIPGITGAVHHVGPPLGGIASRNYIAGVLPNSGENMVRWLVSTQRVKPGSAMPQLGVREQDASDITAYLETLTAE